jgi:hypothetical protein
MNFSARFLSRQFSNFLRQGRLARILGQPNSNFQITWEFLGTLSCCKFEVIEMALEFRYWGFAMSISVSAAKKTGCGTPVLAGE